MPSKADMDVKKPLTNSSITISIGFDWMLRCSNDGLHQQRLHESGLNVAR